MNKLMLCTNLDCPKLYSCLRSMKPLNDSEYIYAEFKYHPINGCSQYIPRKIHNPKILKPMEDSLVVPTPTETPTIKKKNYPKSRKTGKRLKCKHCRKGFLGRANQETCSPSCSKQLYAKKKAMTNNPAPKKRGRPRKDAQPFFTENIKIIKEAPQKALVKKVNLVDATSNKHFVHAIVNNYHEAKLLTALCQSVLPNIEIKIVKL